MKLFKKKDFHAKSDFVKTGSDNLDYLLAGGFPTGLVTEIYGSAGSGKTNICMSAAIEAAKSGSNVVYIDTENNFNKFRFEQIAGSNAKEIAKRIFLHRPRTLKEQRSSIERLEEFLNEDFSLIIVDSFVALYRIELKGERKEIIPFGRELGKQVSALAGLAQDFNAVVLITNQVYDSFAGEDIELKEETPAGGSALNYWSKIILHVEKQGKERLVKLIKHPFREDGESIKLRITHSGID